MKAFQILDTEHFGQNGRYRISKCKTRMGLETYMVFDTTIIDPVTESAICIRQNPLKAIATETLKKDELAIGDKVMNFGTMVQVIDICPEKEDNPIRVETFIGQERWFTKATDCYPIS